MLGYEQIKLKISFLAHSFVERNYFPEFASRKI